MLIYITNDATDNTKVFREVVFDAGIAGIYFIQTDVVQWYGCRCTDTGS